MKFGLVVNLKTDNIGDDIQSYAAKCFLPTIDYVIDREQLDTFETAGESVKVIMNGWYMYSKFNWPPSAQIDPLWVSIHITEQDYFGIGERFLDGCGGDYLRHYAPIGARDESTLQMLERNHIPAFLSGCLTLTIPQFSNVEKTDEVLLVDLDEKSEAIVREMYPAENFQCVTHNVSAEEYAALSVEERLQRVEKFLRRYQGAKCVITSRLHCALPCLALQTPVLLVYKREYAPRMQSFLALLHYTEIDSFDEGVRAFDPANPKANSDAYMPIREELSRRCREFLKDNRITKPYSLPWRDVYLWQKSLLSTAEFTFRNEIAELTSWNGQLSLGKEYLEGQCRLKDDRIDELLHWNKQLETSKTYLEQQVAAKNARISELEQWDQQLGAGKAYLEQQVIAKDDRISELEQWEQQLEAGKAYLEDQLTKKNARIAELEKWCQEVTAGKKYVEAQWHAEEQRREADKQRIDELVQQLNGNNNQAENDTAQ